MVLSFLFPRYVDSELSGSGRGEAHSGGSALHLIQDRFGDAEFGKNLANLSNQFAASSNDRFQFYKSSQLFIRAHNKTLSVVAVRVCNPDRSPVRIKP
jgi:hypothetical protein